MKKCISFPSLFLYAILIFSFSCQRYESPKTTQENTAIDNNSTVLIKVAVKIAIGGILYENLDTHVRVSAYNSANALQWKNDYNATGPEDTLSIQKGFHHYSIELVDKWGINDIQSEIPGKDIWDGRVDGSLPVTYVLGGSKDAKKLSKYVTSREINVSGSIVYQPESRVSYVYSNSHIGSIHHEVYNPQTSQFEETMVETFTYEGNFVSKIVTTLNGQQYSESQYEYGLENKITDTNHSTGIVTTQIITRNYAANAGDSSFTVNYNFSNGQSFLYAFGFSFKNIISDKTVQGSAVCNKGSYTYDKYINPFKHLGYMDFNLQNWSASNKLTERVDFIGCSYPTLIPLFHNYTYDVDGYPVKEITTYKSGANQNSAYHSEIDFYYE